MKATIETRQQVPLTPIRKAGMVLLLTMHNTVTVLLMAYSQKRYPKGTKSYLTPVTVFMGECFKLYSGLFLYLTGNNFQIKENLAGLRLELFQNPRSILSLAVVALGYVMQNNLTFVATAKLDAATFQVSYQLRIFTTAILAAILLGRKIGHIQWLALALLFVGVAIVQLSSLGKIDFSKSHMDEDGVTGLGALLTACAISGFCSIHFEKVVKSTSTDLWIRNVQLAAISIPIAMMAIAYSCWDEVLKGELFRAFDAIVWLLIVMQSLGGLLIAYVVKYADSVVKGFALSLAVVFSVALSHVIFHTELTLYYIFGAASVIIAVYLFSAFEERPAHHVLEVVVKASEVTSPQHEKS